MADRGDFLQVRLGPDAADWVMWVAENQNFGVFGLLGQVLKVDMVAVFVVHERVFDQRPLAVADDAEKRRIDRRLNNYFIARLAEGLHGDRQGGNDAGRADDPGRIDLPMVTFFQPSGQGVKAQLAP